MAKKKQTEEAVSRQPSAVSQKGAKVYDERQRAERVLVSQGRAKGLLDSLPPELQAQLAAWCTELGVVLPAAIEANALLQDFKAKMKAEIDEEEGPLANG